MDDDSRFVEAVKTTTELSEKKIREALNQGRAGVHDPLQASNATVSDVPDGYVGVHLFVMVHGFQGNHNDMRLFKNQISLQYPDAVVLLSTSNEEKTEEDIEEMGERLAVEVKQYVQSFCPASCINRISFIGHSLGGLIIRAALPHLAEYSTKFFTYISLGSPHLGYMYNQNKLFDAGMWLLKKWRNSKSLTQLSMSDQRLYEETTLYRLTTLPGLEWFQNVMLVCSFQDQYAPFDSTRIQICKQALYEHSGEAINLEGGNRSAQAIVAGNENNRGNQYIAMAQNLLMNLNAKLLYRLDVNFHIKDK